MSLPGPARHGRRRRSGGHHRRCPGPAVHPPRRPGGVTEYSKSGMPKTEWCRQHGIPIRQFYYWQNKVRKYLLEHPGITHSDLSDSRTFVPAATTTQSFFELELPNEAAAPPSGQQWPQHQPPCSSLMLCFDRFQLYISDGFSEDALSSIIRAVRNA